MLRLSLILTNLSIFQYSWKNFEKSCIIIKVILANTRWNFFEMGHAEG